MRAGPMEPVISLPPDLAAIAQLPPRGPAPLLCSPGAGGTGPPSSVPFELLLGSSTRTLPGGESWPVGGKKLPLPRLDVAPETAALAGVVVASTAPAVPRLAAAIAGANALPESSSAGGMPVLPVTSGPSAAVPPPLHLPPFAGAEQARAGNAAQQPFLTELAVPADVAPAAAQDAVDAECVPPADSLPTRTTELEGFERLFSNDGRLRAQIAAAAAAEPSAGTSAPSAGVTSLPPVPELRRLPAQQGAPVPRDGIRRLDSLAPLGAPSASVEAPVGSGDWFPAHAHTYGTTGTAAASPSTSPSPQAPVDARLPDWHEAFAQRVQWLVDTDAGEARIRLNPPELGAVDVKISLVDDKTHVHLTAATAAARDELAQALPRLRELFTVSGLELGSASVHDGRAGGQAYGGGEHARHGGGAAHEAPLAGLLDEPSAGPRVLARGRIDVFA